jgi:hypothetical protein
MGRKRKTWAKKRHPVTISLPMDCIVFMDGLLDDKKSRSRYIESLIRLPMRNQQTLAIQEHLYECNGKKGCGRIWRKTGPKDDYPLCSSCYEMGSHVKQWREEE